MVGVDFLDVLRSTGKNLGQTTESAIWSKTYVRWDIFAKSNVYIFRSCVFRLPQIMKIISHRM